MTATITPLAAAKATNRLKGATIGSSVDEIWALRETKRVKEAEIKALGAQIDALEEALLERMDKEDTAKGAGKKATVSVTNAVVANVENWDAFWPYVVKNKFFHLVQKRVSDPGMRELWEQGKTIPGVQPFNKRKVNIRTATPTA